MINTKLYHRRIYHKMLFLSLTASNYDINRQFFFFPFLLSFFFYLSSFFKVSRIINYIINYELITKCYLLYFTFSFKSHSFSFRKRDKEKKHYCFKDVIEYKDRKGSNAKLKSNRSYQNTIMTNWQWHRQTITICFLFYCPFSFISVHYLRKGERKREEDIYFVLLKVQFHIKTGKDQMLDWSLTASNYKHKIS